MKSVLFVASTSYQVLNAINIKKQILRDCNVDIIILNISNSCPELVNVCNRAKCFNNIRLMNVGYLDVHHKFMYYLNRVCKILTMNINLGNMFYDQVFIVGTEAFSKAIYYCVYKNNKDVELKYYEDGTGSYDFILIEDRRKWRHRILKIFYGFELTDKCDEIYVYEPKLVQSNYPSIRIVSIPKIIRGSILFDEIKKCFIQTEKINTNDNIPVLFFDADWGEEKIEKWQKDILRQIQLRIKDDIYVKLHPASEKNKYNNEFQYFQTEYSMEIASMEFDFSNTIFVSICSTACIVNKLVFGDDVKSILLYRVLDESLKRFKKRDIFFNQFIKETNANIYIPKNIEELYSIIGEE